MRFFKRRNKVAPPIMPCLRCDAKTERYWLARDSVDFTWFFKNGFDPAVLQYLCRKCQTVLLERYGFPVTQSQARIPSPPPPSVVSS